MKPEAYRIVLALEALDDPIPATVRMKRALKMLLRSFGLRCTRILPSDSEAVQDDQDDKSNPERRSP